MKKINLFIATLPILLSLNSCIDFSKTDSGIAAPTIESTVSDGIVVAPANLTSAKYINIFRYEVTDGTNNATVKENTTFNIGQINKSSEVSTGTAVTFIDYYTDENKYYQYYIRYKTTSGYLTSTTSGTVKGVGKYAGSTATPGENISTSGEAEIVVGTSGSTTIKYDGDSELLISVADIEIPYIPDAISKTERDPIPFTPMLSINNGTSIQLFELTSYRNTADNKDYWRLDLYKTIPESFFDKDLTVTGIIGLQSEKKYSSETVNESEIIYYRYNFTIPLTEFKIEYPDTETTKIYVSSEKAGSNLYDYTANRKITDLSNLLQN